MTWLYTGAGYWTASSHAANYNEAWFVCDDAHGSIYNAPVTLSSVNGVRPVITVSKSNLS